MDLVGGLDWNPHAFVLSFNSPQLKASFSFQVPSKESSVFHLPQTLNNETTLHSAQKSSHSSGM